MLSLLYLLIPKQDDLFELFKLLFSHSLIRTLQAELTHFFTLIRGRAVTLSSFPVFSKALFITIPIDLFLLPLFHSPIGKEPFHFQIGLREI